MTTLFISDLHIDAARLAINEQFLEFLRSEAKDAAALYILGDLFESWIGDDAPDAAQASSIAGLRELTDSGVPCFVMHGNRDFLLSRQFCAATGAVRPVADMIRFLVAPDGTVVADLKRRLPGRGMWITATRQALRTGAGLDRNTDRGDHSAGQSAKELCAVPAACAAADHHPYSDHARRGLFRRL